MKILSITTSSPICGVAILEDSDLIKEINLNNGLTHSETLLPIIEQIFSETNLRLNDIDLLVTDIGPGSFTGIRIGISTIKAFTDSLGIKAIGVNSLEALKYNIKNLTNNYNSTNFNTRNDSNIICSLIDARKNNVYCEIFENNIIKKEPDFENIDKLLFEIKHLYSNSNLTFVGDGAINYKEKILDFLPNSSFSEFNSISAVNVGIAGFNNYKNGLFSDVQPLYLRKSEAEQKLEEKQNGTK